MRMFRLDVPQSVDAGKSFPCVLQFTEEHLYPLDGKSYTFELHLSCEGSSNANELRGLLEIHTSPLKLQSPVPTTAQVSITHLPSQCFGRSFVLVAKVKALRDIVVESNPFYVVNYRLRIADTFDFDRVLFNDQPGDKFLHIPVQLIDNNGYRVTNRQVPLMVTLHYEDGSPVQPTVQKPSLYQLQFDSINITPKGNDVISIRILQISRNHGGRHFLVRVSARDAENADIAPIECGPFEVRTKKVDGVKESVKLKRPRSPIHHVPMPMPKRIRSPEPFYNTVMPMEESSHDVNSKSVLQLLDSHVHKVLAMRWQEGKVTEEALDAKGNVVRVERIAATPRNPNEFIAEFIRTYDEVIRPQLLKAVHPPTPALTLQNLASLTANKDPRKQMSGFSTFSFGAGDYFDIDNAASSLTYLAQSKDRSNQAPDRQQSGLSLLSDISDMIK